MLEMQYNLILNINIKNNLKINEYTEIKLFLFSVKIKTNIIMHNSCDKIL